MSVLRLFPLVLVLFVNTSFAGFSSEMKKLGSYSNNSNESDSGEPRLKEANESGKTGACGFGSLFGLNSLCPPQVSDEDKKSLTSNTQMK